MPKNNRFKLGLGRGLLTRIKAVIRRTGVQRLPVLRGVIARIRRRRAMAVPPPVGSASAVDVAIANRDFPAVAKAVEAYAAKNPGDLDHYDKWARRLASARSDADARSALAMCLGRLGPDHPRTRAVERLDREDGGATRSTWLASPKAPTKQKKVPAGSDFVLPLHGSGEGSRPEARPSRYAKRSIVGATELAEAKVIVAIARATDDPCKEMAAFLGGESFPELASEGAALSDVAELAGQVEALLNAGDNGLGDAKSLLRSARLFASPDDVILFANDLVRRSRAYDDPRAFSRTLKFVTWCLGSDPRKLLELFFAIGGEVGSADRAFLWTFVSAIHDAAKTEGTPANPEDWLEFFGALRNWAGSDLPMVCSAPLDRETLPDTDLTKLANEPRFHEVIKAAAHSSAQSGLVEAISEKVRKTSVDPVLRVAAEACLAEAGSPAEVAARLNQPPLPAGHAQQAPILLARIFRREDLGSDEILALTPYLADVIVADASQAPAILATCVELGGLQAHKTLLDLLAKRSDSWAADAKALRAHRIDGSVRELESLRSRGPVLVLSDIKLQPEHYQQLALSPELIVHPLDGQIPSGADAFPDVSFIDGSKVNDDQKFIRRMTDLADIVAYSFTERFVDLIKDPVLVEAMADIRQALFASARARLIGVLRRVEISRFWQTALPATPETIIAIVSTPARCAEILESVSGDVAKQINFVFVSKKRGAASAFSNALAQAASADPSKSAERDGLFEKRAPKRFEAALRKIHSEANPLLPVRPEHEPAVLFVNRLAAKTVPGTVGAVFKRVLGKHSAALLDIQTSKDVSPSTFFDQFSRGEAANLSKISTREILADARRATAELEGDPFREWFDDQFSLYGAAILGPVFSARYEPAIRTIGIGFDKLNLAYLLILRETIAARLDGADRGAVFASPGRSVESYCAQTMAARRGLVSVEIVNAWLSGVYTYATPRGDIVTALDAWTKDLLIDFFGIDEHSIRQTGTPRYDGLYARAQSMSRDDCVRKLGLDPSRKTVCVALQPINTEVNLEIINGVFDAIGPDLPVDVIIKPHPREIEARMTAYRDTIAARGETPYMSVALVPQADIIESLVACDLCVTAFSNVGTEAALCERDTLLCEFSGMEPPFRLDEMGLGVATYSRKELSEAIRNVFGGGELKEEIRSRRQEFFSKNRQFIDTVASEEIEKLMMESDLIGAGMNRSLLPPPERLASLRSIPLSEYLPRP